MTDSDINNKILLHNTWLASLGVSGKRFSLKNTYIANYDFSNCNLRGAEIIDVCFDNSDFRNADMRGCVVKNVVFTQSNLRFADFRSSDIDSVDFTSSDIHEVYLPGSSL